MVPRFYVLVLFPFLSVSAARVLNVTDPTAIANDNTDTDVDMSCSGSIECHLPSEVKDVIGFFLRIIEYAEFLSPSQISSFSFRTSSKFYLKNQP